MLDIYDTDGHIDRERVLDNLDGLLDQVGTAVKVTGWASARVTLRQKLADLLDECSEGYAHNPLDSPTMVTEHINLCRRVR